MTQPTKCLLCKHKDPSLKPRTHVQFKRGSVVRCVCVILELVRERQTDSLGLTSSQPSLGSKIQAK